MSYHGLGQTKTPAVDNTARDVGTALNVGGGLIGGLIRAGTGPATTTPTDTTTPAPYVPDVEAPGGGYYWPIAIGVGVLVVGGIAWMGMKAKLPKVAANRRTRRKRPRRNDRGESSSLPAQLKASGYHQEEWGGKIVWLSPLAKWAKGHEMDARGLLAMAVKTGRIGPTARVGSTYVFLMTDEHGRGRFTSYTLATSGLSPGAMRVFVDRGRAVEPNRLTPRQRAALPKSAFVFPSRRAWPLDTPERAYAAIQLLKLGRMGSASDFAKVRNAIMKRHPQVWAMYGRNLSWEKTKRAHAKGIAHRKTSRRRGSRKAA